MKTPVAPSRIRAFAAASLPALAGFVITTAEPPSYPAVIFPDTGGWARNIQRTLRLLPTSTAATDLYPFQPDLLHFHV